MRDHRSIGWAGLLVMLACRVGSAEESPVATEARRILANVRDTRYQHRSEVDEAAGRYWVDCSGLTGLVLRHVDADALATLEHYDRERHPRAWSYHDIFAGAPTNAAAATNGWTRVERIADLRPGDFIAWRKPAWQDGESTGHVIIVDELPTAETDDVWRVQVIHSTSRNPPATGGVARATFWFQVDTNGAPCGVRRRSAQDRSITNLPIAMGRLAVTVAPTPSP